MNIGDKVVCINDMPRPEVGSVFGLKEGQVYVVRGVQMSMRHTGGLVLALIGLYPPPTLDGVPILGYSSKRFRKLDEIRKMSVMRKEGIQ